MGFGYSGCNPTVGARRSKKAPDAKENIVPDSPENKPADVPPSQTYSVPPPIPFPPMGAMPPLAAPPKPNNTMKIVLIVLAVFVGVGLIVATVAGFAIWRLAKAGTLTIDTPNGPISAISDGTVTEADLGVPIYPGAVQAKGTLRVNSPTGPRVQAHFLTPDSKDQVVAFYTDKLGSGAVTTSSAHSALMTFSKSKQESVMLSIVQRPGQNDGKTQIVILRQVNNAAK